MGKTSKHYRRKARQKAKRKLRVAAKRKFDREHMKLSLDASILTIVKAELSKLAETGNHEHRNSNGIPVFKVAKPSSNRLLYHDSKEGEYQCKIKPSGKDMQKVETRHAIIERAREAN